ncbi:MAG TPA: NAD(+)/NADH kinase [Acidimicrobiales bacterium]|jgi:NAD+ kinase|nr:NAD(+)/NADH kinase [Acidimicrobiales bacterium]
MATVALLLHHERAEAAELARQVVAWLAERQQEVQLPIDDAELIGRRDLGVDEAALADGCDLAISLGGDGTMLRTVDVVAPKGVPVLGVNVGQLGYLTEVEPTDVFAALERVFKGEHDIEERMMLDVRVDGRVHTLALNECVVEKTPVGRTVRLKVSLDGEFFTTYAADGVIVATPTGSTAYSFSARGPIVDPAHRAMVITPVSPHMLFDRSMVLAPEAAVRLEVVGHRTAMVSADSRQLAELSDGQAVECTAASMPARLVRFGGPDFHRVLKAKFGLSDR